MKKLLKLWLFVIVPIYVAVFSVVQADTSHISGNSNGYFKIDFKPEAKRINKGAEESVALHVEGKKSENIIIELESSHPKIISLDPDSKRVRASGTSINDIKIIAKKEGSATITATIVKPPPAEVFNSKQGLPSTGITPALLSDSERRSLEQENGFRQDHAGRMHTFAQDKGVFLIVRDGNTDSVVHFSNENYMPKPMSCKAKTAKVGLYKGLVVNPIHPKQAEAWDKAIAEAGSTTDKGKKLEEQRAKAKKSWKDYNASMISKGYKVNEDTGVIEYVNSTVGAKVWKGIHGDYDLHGVYRRTGDESVQRIDYGNGVKTVNGQVFRSQLNQWLTKNNPKDFIQHGGQDDWTPDPAVIEVKPPDPPAVVFFPDGRAPKRLNNTKEMIHFYEYEMGVLWPYETDDKDEDRTEVKAELSVKVIDLVKDLKQLSEDNKIRLLEESKKNIKKLEAAIKTPKLPKRHTEKGYAYLYMDSAYRAASEVLGNDISAKQLPVEGYAILPSFDVYKQINKDRNFTEALIQKIGKIGFDITQKKTLGAKDIKQSIDDIKNLRDQIVSKIVEEYKIEEAKIIHKAFSKFVTEMVHEFPEMGERLIRVQAFYKMYKENEKKFNQLKSVTRKKMEPLINQLIKAKKLVDGAVLLYTEGPIGFFKILIVKVAKDGCYFTFDYVDEALVAAGGNAGGPIGAFAGYAVSRVAAYGVCDVMINAVFESIENYFSSDSEVDRWVKIFYTGEEVDNTLPHDVNFFLRFGWKRVEILDKMKGPDKLQIVLNRHLINLWNKYPDLREYLDVKGDIGGVDWDNEKGKEIWKKIFETADNDITAKIHEKLKSLPIPSKGNMDIEKYIVDESTESWFGVPANNISMLAKVLVEHPRMANKENIPKEFSMNEVVNLNMRFLLLGYAGHNEHINIQWTVVDKTGVLFDTVIKKKSENITIVFPEKDIEDVDKQIKLKESKFSFKINKESFNPESSYSLDVILKNSKNILRTFKIHFTVKPDEDKDKNATIKILSQLNQNKLDALLKKIGRKNAPKGFYNCLCAKHPYFKTTNMGLSHHPEKAPFSPICNQVGAPCMAHGYGCTRYAFPDGDEIWSECINSKKYEDNSTIVDVVLDKLKNMP